MRCGALFTIAADTKPGLTMSLTLTANGVEHDLSISVRKDLTTVTQLIEYTCFKPTLTQMLSFEDKETVKQTKAAAEPKYQRLTAHNGDYILFGFKDSDSNYKNAGVHIANADGN